MTAVPLTLEEVQGLAADTVLYRPHLLKGPERLNFGAPDANIDTPLTYHIVEWETGRRDGKLRRTDDKKITRRVAELLPLFLTEVDALRYIRDQLLAVVSLLAADITDCTERRREIDT